MKNSIKQRLLLYLITFTLLVWGVITVNSYFETQHQIEELFDAELAQAAKVLLELSDHELHEQLAYLKRSGNTEKTLDPVVPTQVHKYEQHLEYQIWIDNKKHLAVRTRDAPNTPMTNLENKFSDFENNGKYMRVFALSNSNNTIHVQIAGDYRKRDEISNAISIKLLTSMGLSLPLLAILILIGVGKSFAPLEKIAREMGSRKYDNLTAIDEHDTPIEVRPLINALNHLFKKLEVAFSNISRFTADAAHELRTPLAALKVHAQVAQREKDENARNTALNKIITGVDNATNIVEQLLMLSRLDPESSLIKNEKSDLGCIAETTIAELTPSALEKNIEISLDKENNTFTNGKEGMLRIMVKNLVENAIRYTPHGGIIEVNVKPTPHGVVFQIADSGPGIQTDEMEDVFKRFFRGKNSNDIQGTGLGLSIVSRIIEIHHAKIKMGQSRFNGLQVDVLFSAAENTADKNTVPKNTSHAA